VFDDIRPYADAEVRPILNRLIKDPELLQAVRGLLFQRWPVTLSKWLDPLIVLFLRWQLRNVHSVDALQSVIEKYLIHAVDTTTSGFSVSGLENVPRDRACLFIGNHRDIVLDPAFMSHALKRSGIETCRVAIGDNLLSKQFVAELMRLNKCFIVKRSASGPRQLLKRYQQLSQFIQHSIVQDKCSIWIAQREGRAKNGDDRTEAAIIKMIHMAGKKQGLDLNDYLAQLVIVPVSISYEYDPCDALKARELHTKAKHGDYEKQEHEDINSIAKGVSGQKGRVHLSFCAPIHTREEWQQATLSADQIAAMIDQQIHRYYRLHSSNIAAYKEQGGVVSSRVMQEVFGPEAKLDLVERRTNEFRDRLQQLPAEYSEFLLAMYATPVSNHLSVRGDDVQ